MKRFIGLISCLWIGALGAWSQSGVWTGSLDVRGMRLPIVFHLNDDNPTMDSPAQGAKGIPVQVERSVQDSITIWIPLIGGSYSGKYETDTIRGTFSQRGITLPLLLMRGERIINRPQTPTPPFPYSHEEVSFNNGDAVLKGTLTLPSDYNRDTPVLIMVTGSGLQNRDEEILDHKPFAVIADALARNGIASLRYDDRGFGESTGDAVNCTTDDLKGDALAGIDLLRRKFNKVGVLGHSEGGTIALMLGAEKKVDFIVSLAGMVMSGRETLLDQNRSLLTKAGYPQNVVEEYCEILNMAFNGEDSILAKLESSGLPVELKKNIQGGLGQLRTPYMRYFLDLDLRDRLGKVKCPVLALNGTKDTQVFHRANLSALKAGLPKNINNRIEELEGLNHLFQHCETGSTSEYAIIEETISPDVLALLSQWINSLSRP